VAAHKKNAARLGAHIVFADESGFLLIPNVVRTWLRRAKLQFIVTAKDGGTRSPSFQEFP
jgi:hypothetical protein